MIDFLKIVIICTGVGHTTPKTDIELEFRDPTLKFSTIRYEISEGSYSGTAFIQSMGRIGRSNQGPHYKFKSEGGPRQTILTFDKLAGKIENAKLTHDGSNNVNDDVLCEVED